ncbi:MAG TPA: hypothetical protein V6C84_17405 [Coleofasciculaceae cyanobacterium]|jgi:hypothetical protein
MTGSDSISIPPVSLPEQVPDTLPELKFQLGQKVRWSYVPSQDFGRVLGVIYGSEGSVRALGYHYAIALDTTSPSYANGILTDWAFEEDLELYTPDPQIPERPPLDLAPQASLHTD